MFFFFEASVFSSSEKKIYKFFQTQLVHFPQKAFSSQKDFESINKYKIQKASIISFIKRIYHKEI